MQVKTWLQRLTDESSLWFNAVKAEDDGDMISAASYYLKDAQKSAQDKSLVREALSCSCSATCLLKKGNLSHARRLYLRAGELYSSAATLAMSSSIREATWSLREAYDNYVLAGDSNASSQVRKDFLGLASRVNPFSEVQELESKLDLINKRVELLQGSGREEALPLALEELIDVVLANRASLDPKKSRATLNEANVMKSLDLSGGSSIDEKSIVS